MERVEFSLADVQIIHFSHSDVQILHSMTFEQLAKHLARLSDPAI